MSEQVHATGPHDFAGPQDFDGQDYGHQGFRPMYRPSRDESQGLDAGTRRILYLSGFGGLAILVGVAIYSLTGHSGSGVVPVVQADEHPIRVKPANPGGMAVGPVVQRADPNDSHIVPGTEEPNPKALLAITGTVKPPPRPPGVASARPKSFTVQLSEVKTEAQAQVVWDKLAKKMPDLFAQHRALYQKINESGSAPWRLRTGGFADQAQAKAFCDKVKAKGGQCALVES
jgi:hypothetical protein